MKDPNTITEEEPENQKADDYSIIDDNTAASLDSIFKGEDLDSEMDIIKEREDAASEWGTLL